MKVINIHTDGGARGNPGPAAIGVFIEGDGEVLEKVGKRIGETTNNVAEYSAVLEALDFLLQNKKLLEKKPSINFFLDSELVCSQINGLYKIKNPNLRNLLFKVRQKESQIEIPISYSYIGRENNKIADKLVNLALDNML